MNRTDAIAWTLSVCIGVLRLSQAKTLSQLVAAAVRCERASLASIGRLLCGDAKHQIKRVWRFCANQRIETADAMGPVLSKILGKRKKRLIVCLDWTDIKGFQTLMASIAFKGRSIPVCWASCTGHVYDGHRSRNAFEESLLLILRQMIPAEVKVTLLGDRGFGRTELARFCQRHGFDYIIRIRPEVIVRCRSYRGKLLDYPVHKGVCRLLKQVDYRDKNPVNQHIVIRWVRDLPPKRDACWFLMTNLTAGPARISRLYARRMTIEQLFRDLKNKRNGWSLRDTRITRPDRLDRLLLILAIAYLLLCGLGLLALATARPSQWQSASRNQCSVFQIGRHMRQKWRQNISTLLHAIIHATEIEVPKWG